MKFVIPKIEILEISPDTLKMAARYAGWGVGIPALLSAISHTDLLAVSMVPYMEYGQVFFAVAIAMYGYFTKDMRNTFLAQMASGTVGMSALVLVGGSHHLMNFYWIALSAPIALVCGFRRTGLVYFAMSMSVIGLYVMLYKPAADSLEWNYAKDAMLFTIVIPFVVFAVKKWQMKIQTEMSLTNERNRLLVQQQIEDHGRFELLIASISHDLRTPMQSLQSASYLLGKAHGVSDRRKYSGIVNSSIKTLARLVEDIAKAAQGKAQVLQLRYVDLRHWFADFIPAYQDKAALKGLTLTYDIETEDLSVEIDPERMTQSVGNLVDNAIKYTMKGSISVSVKLDLSERIDGRRVLVIKVRDSGAGISRSDQDRIFLPFVRVIPHGYENEQGTGLGLSIVRSMAQSYPGGSVTVRSMVGRGSRFKLALPVRFEVPSSRGGDSLSSGQSGSYDDGGSGQKEILVVDDDPLILAAVQGVLYEAGYAIDIANNGAEALEKAARHGYKVIISDVQMPVMDGFELARSIQAIVTPTPYLIAMTAYTSALQDDARSSVFADFLEKPFDEKKLIAAVGRGIGDEVE